MKGKIFVFSARLRSAVRSSNAMIHKLESTIALSFALACSLLLGRRASGAAMAERALALDRRPRPVQYRGAAGLLSLDRQFARASDLERRAVELKAADRFDLWWQAMICADLGRFEDAIDCYRRYAVRGRRQYAALAAIARLYRRLSEPDTLGCWRKVAESWEAALRVNAKKAADWSALGEAYLALNQPDDAREALEQADARLPGARRRALGHCLTLRLANIKRERCSGGVSARILAVMSSRTQNFCQGQSAVQTWYLLGRCYEQLGDRDRSSHFYHKAFQNSDDAAVRSGGIGALHVRNQRWLQALAAFERQHEQQPHRPDTPLKIGHIQRRIGCFEQAAQSYEKARSVGADEFDCAFYCGLALEYGGRLDQAARQYRVAAQCKNRRRSVVYYRLGLVLTKASRHEQACSAFLRIEDDFIGNRSTGTDSSASVDVGHKGAVRDCSTPATWWRQGGALEAADDWAGAARCFQAALDREPDHCPEGQYRLGRALYNHAEHKSAAEVFVSLCVDRDTADDPHGSIFAQEPPPLPICYVHYWQNLPIRQNVVLYESYDGATISGNPRAIFEQRSLFDPDDSWLHVWVVADLQTIPAHWKSLPNVVFVTHRTQRCILFHAIAGYLVNNSGVPDYFTRRPQQKFLNTWHGTPLKTLGKNNKTRFNSRGGMQRVFLQTTHIISPNTHTSNVILDQWDLRPIYTGVLAETGYPRVDLTLNADEAVRKRNRDRLGLNRNAPVILFAPTWRGTIDAPDLDVNRLRADLRAMRESGAQLVFRGHHLVEQRIQSLDIECALAPSDMDTNELLSVIDILVTDYSSVCVEFLPLQKPVIYYAHDQDEYAAERGLYLLPEDMPGSVCHDRRGLIHELRHAVTHISDHARHDLTRFNPHDDGLATRRVIDFFFHDDLSHVVHSERDTRETFNALIYPGVFESRRTIASLRSLIDNLGRNRACPVIAVSPEEIEYRAERRARFAQLDETLALLPRVGPQRLTARERRCIEDARRENVAALSPAHAEIIAQAFGREFQRMAGCARFDAVIDLGGYDWFWSALFAHARGGFRRMVYLHDDMRKTQRSRFYNLLSAFALYPRFDTLVSTKPRMCETNRANLAATYAIDPERFICADDLFAGSADLEPGLGPSRAAMFCCIPAPLSGQL